MTKLLLSFTILLATATNSYSQVPAGEVINAEKSFALMALEQNTQAAFVHYMSDSSVIEQKGELVKGLPVFSKMPADTKGKLLWRPTFAAIASSGDFGYTTGPYTYNINGKNVAFGNYATVWQKQQNGQWKLIIDLGAPHRDSLTIEKDTVISVLPDPTAKSSESADLIVTDQMFAAKLAAGSHKIYKDVLHPAAHILRSGKVAYVSDEQKQGLFSEVVKINFKPQLYKIASSNDLGVVYGSCELEMEKEGKKVQQQAVYMHVWRKDG